MLDKIWNGQIFGLPHLIVIIVTRIKDGMLDKLTSIFAPLNFAKSGKNIKISRGLFYRDPRKIFFGSNITIGRNVSFSTEYLEKGDLVIEDGASIGNNTLIDFTGGVKLCRDAHLAHNVYIITHDHGYNYKNIPVGKPLTIEENAFIGSNVIILHNVNTIGKNAVIGTGSVVTKDVLENTIVAGNPARIIVNVGKK